MQIMQKNAIPNKKMQHENLHSHFANKNKNKTLQLATMLCFGVNKFERHFKKLKNASYFLDLFIK